MPPAQVEAVDLPFALDELEVGLVDDDEDVLRDLAMKSSSSACCTDGPVGLLGVQTSTTRVRSVIAAAMASRSWRWSAVSGTWTDVAPAIATTIGYASKERHAYTTSSPGSHVDWMIWASTPTEPVPVAICSRGTARWAASASVRAVTPMSG